MRSSNNHTSELTFSMADLQRKPPYCNNVLRAEMEPTHKQTLVCVYAETANCCSVTFYERKEKILHYAAHFSSVEIEFVLGLTYKWEWGMFIFIYR